LRRSLKESAQTAILLDEPEWAEYLEIVETDLAELVQPN
jgi:hypothetical protein